MTEQEFYNECDKLTSFIETSFSEIKKKSNELGIEFEFIFSSIIVNKEQTKARDTFIMGGSLFNMVESIKRSMNGNDEIAEVINAIKTI